MTSIILSHCRDQRDWQGRTAMKEQNIRRSTISKWRMLTTCLNLKIITLHLKKNSRCYWKCPKARAALLQKTCSLLQLSKLKSKTLCPNFQCCRESTPSLTAARLQLMSFSSFLCRLTGGTSRDGCYKLTNKSMHKRDQNQPSSMRALPL